jgi:hypothetical protein
VFELPEGERSRPDRGKTFAASGGGAANIVVAVRRGNEERFELRRGQKSPSAQHFLEKGCKAAGIGLFRGGIVVYRARREK